MARPVGRHRNLPDIALATVYVKDVKHGCIADGSAELGPDMPRLFAVPVSARRRWVQVGTHVHGPERRRVRPLRLRHHAKINFRSVSDSRQTSLQ